MGNSILFNILSWTTPKCELPDLNDLIEATDYYLQHNHNVGITDTVLNAWLYQEYVRNRV